MSIDLAVRSGSAEPQDDAAAPAGGPRRWALTATGALSAAWRRAAPLLWRSLRAHTLFIALIVAYVSAELYLPAMLGIATPFKPAFGYTFFASLSGLTLAVPACFYVFYVIIFVRPQRLTAHLVADVCRFVSIERLATGLPVFLLFPFFGSAFSYFRIYIPSFHPFDWDPTLAEWDRLVHGGSYSWEWLQPVL